MLLSRHQLVCSSKECEQQKAQQQQLKKELQEMTDLTGETQHNYIHCYTAVLGAPSISVLFNAGQLRSQHATELEDLKKTLSSQEGIISSQRQELCGVKEQLETACGRLEAQEEEQKVLQEKKAVELRTEIETIKRESEKVKVNKKLQKK